jgi:hypothetical protein
MTVSIQIAFTYQGTIITSGYWPASQTSYKRQQWLLLPQTSYLIPTPQIVQVVSPWVVNW